MLTSLWSQLGTTVGVRSGSQGANPCHTLYKNSKAVANWGWLCAAFGKIRARMKRLIFAADADGTLLMDNNEVHPHTRAACQAARAQGHVVVIATGRALVRARPLLVKLADVDYLVCNNGALVYDLQRQRPLHLEGVNPLHYLSIVDFARQHRLSFKLHTDQDWIGDVGIEDQQPTPLTPALDQQIRAHIYKHPRARQLFNGQTPTQLSIHGSKQFCQAQLARFRAWFGADSNVVIANDVYLDVNPRHTSK